MSRARDLAAFVSNADGDIKFDTDTLFIDSSENRVGISNSSPETKLHINDSGTAPPSSGYGTGLNVSRSDGLVGVTVGYNSANLGSYIQAKNFTNSDMKDLLLNPNGGNVIVGDDTASTLFKVKGTGDLAQLVSTNSGAGGAQIDLKHESASPANGDSIGIINFSGYDSSSLSTQYASVVGKALDTSAEQGALDIGIRESSGTYSHTKFRFDRHGLKFNGDTAEVNALDDYEEGLHTPILYGNTTGSNTLIPVRSAYDKLAYTKIGRVVHIGGKIETSGSHSASGYLKISLPFQVAQLDDIAGACAGTAFFYRTGQLHDNPVILASEGNSYALFYQSTSNGDVDTINAQNMDSAIELFIGLTYFTNT